MKPKIRITLFALGCALAVPLSALENDGPRREHLKRLGAALRAYGMINQGQPPVKLSLLVDEGLFDGAGALLRPGSAGAVPPRAEIDARADYTLEPLGENPGLVLREKSPLAGEREVLALFKDGTIRALAAGGAPAPPTPTPAALPAPGSSAPRTLPPSPAVPPAAWPETSAAPASVQTGARAASPQFVPPAPRAATRDPVVSAPADTPRTQPVAPTEPARAMDPVPGFATRGDLSPEQQAAVAEFAKLIAQRAEAAAPREEAPAFQVGAGAAADAASPGGIRFISITQDPPEGSPNAPATTGATAPGAGNRPAVTFKRTPEQTPATDAEFQQSLAEAQAAEARGDMVKASYLYGLASHLRPDLTTVLASHARALNRTGELEESVLRYLALQARDPQTPGVALRLAELYVGLQDVPRARREAQRAVAQQPDSGLALSWLATVEMLAGERAAAAARFRQALQRDPMVINERSRNAEWMLAAGQERRVAIEAESILMMDPRNAGAMLMAGEAYAALDEREPAIRHLKGVVLRDSQGPLGLRARKKLWELEGEPGAAQPR